MNKLYSNEIGKFIRVFLEDILIYCETWEDNLEHQRTALQRIFENESLIS